MVYKRRTVFTVMSIFLILALLCPLEITRISEAIDVSDGTLSDWVNATVQLTDPLGDSPVDMTDLVFVAFDFDDTWLYVRWDIDNDGTKASVLYDMGINITASGITWDIYVAAQIERIAGTPTLTNISIRDPNDVFLWNASDDGSMIEDGTLYFDPPPGGTPGTISVEARFPLSYIASSTGLIFSQFRSHSSIQVTSNVKDHVPDSGYIVLSVDGKPPELANLTDFPDPQSSGGNVNITVDVTDNYNVDTVWVNITYPDGSWNNVSMFPGSGDGWFYNTSYLDPGLYSYTVWANDSSDNWNGTGPGTFMITGGDAIPPELFNLNDFPDPQNPGGFVNISVEITDNAAVDEVWVNITFPDTSWVNVTMLPGTGNIWFYNNTYADLGIHSYTIWANDTSDNWNSTGPGTFTIQDSEGPELSNLDDTPDPQENDGYVNITVDVTDNVGVGEVWVNITYPDASWTNVSMYKGAGNEWYYNTTYADLGVYSYTVWANDTSNNWNSTSPGTFTTQDTDGPEFTNLNDAPDPQLTGGYVNITVDVTDDVGVDEVWVNITFPDATSINVSMQKGSGDGWYYNTTYPDIGVHLYTVWANDTSDNWNSTGPGTFTILGTGGPEFNNLNDSPDPQENGGYVNISVDVTDDVAVDKVWVNITYPDGSYANVTMIPESGDNWYYNSSYAELGSYSYVVWANDTSNNWNITGPGTFTIQDTDGPQVSNLGDSPDPQESGDFVNITVDVIDDVGIDEVRVNITYPNGSWINISMVRGIGDEWFFNTTYADLGIYSYTVWTNDTSNNWNSTGPGTFTIQDTDGPEFDNLLDSPDPQAIGGYVNITVNVTDDIAVGEVWINISYPNGSWVNVSMQKDVGDGWYHNDTFIDTGIYSYTVWANDTIDNWNSTGPGTFEIKGDVIPPELFNLNDFPDPQNKGGFVNITLDVTDDIAVDEVWINITYPNGSWINVSMTQGAGDEWFHNDTYDISGTYSYTVWANDTSENWNSSGSQTFIIQDTGFPELNNLDDIPDPQENNGYVNITVDVTDDVGVDEVWVNIIYPDATWVNVSMDKGAGNEWYYNITYADLGVYSYTVWANDTSDNWNSTGPGIFTIQDTDGPEFNNLIDTPDPQENDGYVNITVDVTDDVGVDEVWVNITYPASSWVNISMDRGTGNEWYYNTNYADLGVYSYIVWANDTSDNWNKTSLVTFTIQDTDGPEFINIGDMPDPQEIGGSVNITVDVLDDIGVDEVWVNITFSNGTWINTSMIQGIGDEYYLNTTYSNLGINIYTIWANDTSGNWNNSVPKTFEIKTEIIPPVVWNSNDFPDPQEVGGFVNITVNASDNVAVDEVWVNISFPDGGWINDTMLQSSVNGWYHNTTYSDIGNHIYMIWVNDTSDNWRVIGPGTFLIRDVNPPEFDNLVDTPDPQNNGGYVNITVDVTDDVWVDGVWINLTFPNGTWINVSMNRGTGNGWYYNDSYGSFGYYTYIIWANDTSDNWNSTSVENFEILGFDAPPELWDLRDFPDPQEVGGFVNITVNVNDDVGVDEVWLDIVYPNSAGINASMFPSGGNRWFYTSAFTPLGIYSYTVWAKDTSSQWNTTSPGTFTIQDVVPPEFENLIDEPDPQENNEYVNISVDVIDDVAVDVVWINLRYPNGSWTNMSMRPGRDDKWYLNTPYNDLGLYIYSVWARDTSDNLNTSGPESFIIHDTDGPEIVDLNVSQDQEREDGDINITVDVTDDVGIERVWINIIFPDGTWFNDSMDRGIDDEWYYNAEFDILGNYTFTILAVDTSGNWNSTEPETFSIEPDKKPEKPSRSIHWVLLLFYWPLILILFTMVLVRRYEPNNRFKKDVEPLASALNYYYKSHPEYLIDDATITKNIISLSVKMGIPLEEFIIARLIKEGALKIEGYPRNSLNEDLKAIKELLRRY